MRQRVITTSGFVFLGLFILINGLISQSYADEIKIKIPISTVTVSEDNEGNAKYSGDNVQYLTQSGEPMIPYQVVKVLLPPDADLNTVSGTIDTIKIEELTGEWDVRPKPPEVNWDGNKVITVWPKGKTIVNGYDINIYERNTLFPEKSIGTITAGQTRRWRLVDIPIALYKYNPVAKKLLRLVEGELIVEYSTDPTAISILKEKTGIPDRIGEDSAKRITVNFNEVSPTYEKIFPQALTPQQIGRYVIITTDNIKFGSGELQNFVSSKEMRGFTVEVVTEGTWGGGIGDTAAENIRDWLSNNYENKNIEYVLLIGNPNPNAGDVPMKMLWPRSDATEYRESPSDYYYADLTGNWDLDNDGLYGERIDDFGSGGVDRNWDVLVGRLPYYGNMNDLDAILAKIIAYENETSDEAVWRQNVLLPMKPSDSNTPGYHLGEAIKDDIVEPKDNWDYHRVYDEDYGLIPPPETYPCTVDNVTDAWDSYKYGAIFWWTHGWSKGASSIMDLSHAATLHDSYPGFTFQASCNNSWPEVTDNLSYSLLKNGCIGTIGATRVSWYYPGQTYFVGSTSNAGMTYDYSKRLIENEMDSGHALYEMKQVLVPGIWMNFTVFNIYGDPSTGLFTFTEFKGLQNGDFEQGVADTVFFWTTDAWKPAESLMAWEPFGEGYQGSRSVSIEHTKENDSRWIQVVSGLLPGMEYRLSGWIKGQNIVNVTGTIGANLCLFGTWEHTPGISGTFDWTEVSMNFTAPANGVVVTGCRLGYWGNTTTGKVWFDNISLELKFIDVLPGSNHEASIYAIYNAGITTGCSQNPLRFCPQDPVTRAQMASFIIRALEGEPPSDYCDTGSPFPDVDPNLRVCKYIKRLSELEITTGYPDGTYRPYNNVTRAQMAAFIVRAKEGEPPSDYCATGSPFPDVAANSPTCKYIKRLFELGITTGYSDGTYRPGNTVIRRQMAAFLDRAFLKMD